MHVRFPTSASILMVFVVATAVGCNRSSVTPTSPGDSGVLKSPLAAQPMVATAEILQSSACPTHPPFGVHITVIVGGEDLIVRGLRFAFTDRLSRRALPTVLAGLGPTSFPTSTPIPFPGVAPLPTTSPISIPGGQAIEGLFVSADSTRSLPFFLRFDCGLVPAGTIVVTADLTDRYGRPGPAELRVTVRQ